MDDNNKIFEEALSVISDGQEELPEEKKVIYDKTTGQISIKIPKNLALKKGLNEKSIFEIVLNPNNETIERAKNSKFILFVKEVKSGEGKTKT
ncbi:MAG: hypothetical protein Q8O84_04195 [Nanoarchaeota archaeon]|nr:hypothetical protein [Nanoarchaeota archaeon]